MTERHSASVTQTLFSSLQRIGGRAGIKVRLYAAFGAVVALTLAATATSWLSFQNFETSLQSITDDSLPHMGMSLKLSEFTGNLTAIAPVMMTARTQNERQSEAAKVQGIQDKINKIVAEMDDTSAASVANNVEAIVNGLNALNASVETRLNLAENREKNVADIAAMHKEFLALVVPKVDDAGFNLTINIEAAADAGGPEAIANELKRVGTDDVAKFQSLLEIMAQGNLTVGILNEASNLPNAELIQPAQERFIAAAAKLTEQMDSFGNNKESEDVNKLIKKLIAFGNTDGNIFDKHREELTVKNQGEEVLKKMRGLSVKINELVNGIVAENQAQTDQFGDVAKKSIQRGQLFLMVIASISLVAACLIAWLYVGRNLVDRLTALAAVTRRIADGESELQVPVRGNDELTAMAQAVRVFRDNAIEKEKLEKTQREAEQREAEAQKQREAEARERLEKEREAEIKADAERREAEQRSEEEKRETLRQLADAFEANVLGVVDAVGTASSEMQETAKSMSATAEETSTQAGAVASASEIASSNVTMVSSAAEELSASIAEIKRQVTESSNVAARAVDEAAKTNETVQTLADAAQKIGDVVDLINDIASQTNLLALNATIEAARAGEAGKGFAVVASEVKSLATQTAKATEEIANQVASMQGTTNKAVEAIDLIGTTIGDVNTIATSVTAAIEQQGSATQEIARNVQEAATGTQEVSANIGNVTQAAGETGAAARQVLDASEDLSRQSEQLREQVDSFLRQVRAM